MSTAHASRIRAYPPRLRTIRTLEVRFLRELWHKLRNHKSGQTEIQKVSDRELRLVNAWLANGAPADLTVEKEAMDVPQGECFRVDVKAKRLEPVESTDSPGYYLEREKS